MKTILITTLSISVCFIVYIEKLKIKHFKTLKKQALQPVPMEMLAAAPDATKRALQTPGAISPDLLNELIRAKPANIGTALRDWATPKKN